VPQPQFAGTPPICKFGGLALPNGQGTMAQVNLNDVASWYLQDFQQDLSKQLVKAQYIWRARGATLGRDFPGFNISLPFRYKEVSNGAFGAILGVLSQAGEQQLTFDNNTFITAEFEATKSRKHFTKFQPYWYDVTIQFWCKTPWFQDIASTSLPTVNIVNAPTAAPSGATAAGGALVTGTYTLQYTFVTASGETAASPVSGNIILTTGNQQISVSAVTPLPAFATAVKWYFASGPTVGFTVQNNGAAFTLNTAGNTNPAPSSTPATQFSVNYAGSIWAEPVWTLTIPSSNAAVITSATLFNTMSGEQLTAQLGGLAASTAYTITMDSSAMTILDGSSKPYDNIGNAFANLYGPAGQSNAFTIAVATSSGLPSGLTLGGSWNPRWVI
jgi:hypothetical protein